MKKQTIAALMCMAVILTSFLTGFFVSKDFSKKPVQVHGADEAPPDYVSEPVYADGALYETEEPLITPSTKMVYEYYYAGDGVTETAEGEPPYFLIDKAKSDVEAMFSEWAVTSFSSDEVVMRKQLEGSSGQYYIVGVHEGFIAVFYATEINGTNLKDVTDTPARLLPSSEQELLKAGIHVLGQEALDKVLEAYGS